MRRAYAWRVATGLAFSTLAAPVVAQIALSATATSNYVYRGVSLSDARPAVSISAAYDHGDGAYAGGAFTVGDTRYSGFQALGHVEYVGYAGRLKRGAIWDVGVINTHVTNYYYSKYDYDLTEAYAGLRGKILTYYLYYSPDYYRRGVHTLYAQVGGTLRPAPRWRLFGHIGVLTSLGGYVSFRQQYDLEAGVASHFKPADVQLAWTIRGPDQVYLAGRTQARSAIRIRATREF